MSTSPTRPSAYGSLSLNFLVLLKGESGRGSPSRRRSPATWRTAGTARTTETRVGIGNATFLSKVDSRINLVADRGVDTERQPSEETILDRVAEKSVLHHRVNCASRALGEKEVLSIGGQGLTVGVVRGRLLNSGDEILVEVSLANVASIVVMT